MRIAVVSSRYPSPYNPYVYAFVHTRVKQYLKKGIQTTVLVPAKEKAIYEIEGVQVHRMPALEILSILQMFDVVMLHLLHISHMSERDGSLIYEFLLREQQPTIIFIHGIEVQRIFLSRREQIHWLRPRSIAVSIYHDFFQIPKIKYYFARFLEIHSQVRFVAVSRWMLSEVKRNLGLDLNTKATIIPNGIDTQLFTFKDRWASRHRLLTIRPLILKGKYAVDLALETMRYVPSTISLNIYGQGPDAAKIRARIRAYGLQKQVHLSEKFFLHSELPQIHEGHGIYYAVTRMDSQGVSMGEAMASGLPVISFAICGIPEFVHHGQSGLLIPPYDVRQAAEAIQALVEDRDLYQRLAEGGRRFVESISIERTTARELALAKSLLTRP